MYTEKNISNLGNNLKFLREKKGISLSQLSKHIGITKQSLSYYERGERLPDIHNLIKIAVYYNTSIDSIIFSNSDINLEKLNTISSSEYSSNILSELKSKLIEANNFNNKIISILDTSNTNNSNFEISEELSITEQNNLTELEYLNSIDIDFYDKNNIIIFNAPKYYICEKYDTSKIPNIAPISAGYPSFTTNDADRFFNIESDDLAHDADNYFALRVNGDSMNKLYKNGDHILVERTSNVKNGTPAIVIIENDYATFKIFSKDDDAVYLTPQSTNPKHKIQTYPLDEYKYRVIGKVLGVINEFE